MTAEHLSRLDEYQRIFPESLSLPIVANIVLLAVTLVLSARAIVIRYRGERVGRRLRIAGCVAIGAYFGCVEALFTSLLTFDPLPLSVAIALAWVLGGLEAFGMVTFGAGVAWSGLAALDYLAFGVRDHGGISTIAVVLGVVTGTVGGAAWGLGRWRAKTRDRHINEDRFIAVGQALRKQLSLGSIPIPRLLGLGADLIGVLITITLGNMIPVPWPVAVTVGALGFGFVGAETELRVWPRRVRMAYELIAWLHLLEVGRFPRSALPIPTTPKGALRWLQTHPRTPETDLLRIELLCWVQSFEEARSIADQLPSITPPERFRRLSHLAFVDWMSGLDGDPDGVAAAAVLLPAGSVERAEADAAAALHHARARLALGGDWLGPLVEGRTRLPTDANHVLARLYRRKLVVEYLVSSAVIALVLSGGLAMILAAIT